MRDRAFNPAFSLLPLFGLLVVAVSPAVGAHRSPALPLEFQVDIPYGYFEYVSIDAAASTNSVVFDVGSNVTMTTAFMTSSQFTAFNDTQSEIADSVYFQNGTASQGTEHVPKGDY